MKRREDLHSKYAHRSHEELLAVIERLEALNNKLTHKLFGSVRERYVADPEGMKLLFDEIEEIVSSAETFGEDEKVSQEGENSEKKPRGRRNPLPDNLPCVKKYLDLPEEKKFCSLHQVALVKIGEEHSEKIEIEPAKAYIEDTITIRYKCPCCDEFRVFSAERPIDPIPKSFASPGLLAYVATQKFVDGLPLSRQERIFERASIDLNRTTLARWMIKCGELVAPLISLLHEDLINSPIAHADETHVQVLDEPNRPAEAKSYMWCMARSGPQPIIFFRYYDNRSKRAADDLLRDFKGILVTDAYKVYDSLQPAIGYTLAGCWAHARRRFFEVEKFAKKSLEPGVNTLAAEAMMYIRKLHKLDDKFASLEAHERLKKREDTIVPLLDKFHAWLSLHRDKVLPKSPLGKAINCTLSNWKKLEEFARHADVPMTNNFIEGHIRPFAIGRNAWLFSATPAGANASANLYTLVECAKANRIEPFDYLKLIFKELPSATTLEQIENLLPYNAARHFPLRQYSPSKK